MKLSEIIDDQEPLLIYFLDKLLRERKPVWLDGLYDSFQIKKIETAIVDRPANILPRYYGKAYAIVSTKGGTISTIMPDEADQFELVKRDVDKNGKALSWTLRRRNG